MHLTIMPNLAENHRRRWVRQFVAQGRDYLESIWRRSQDAVPDPGDPTGRRRRMIHVIDKYDMVPVGAGRYDFCITECYLWLCSTLPRQEVIRYLDRVNHALGLGEWKKVSTGQWVRDELTLTVTVTDYHEEDKRAGRNFGCGYQTVECTLISRGFPKERLARESPWAVLNSGVRVPGTRVPNPMIVEDMSEILPYLPAQIEIGGGASLELGIPPLNYLHTVYGLYTPDEQFAYGDTDKLLAELLPDPEVFYTKKASVPYAGALAAQPNDFYRLLADMHAVGLIVGPVVTNNFDGLCSLMNLEEYYVRRYEETHIVPDIQFHPNARSLLVVGSHADRRRIQQAAKHQGLKIIYVDPESYVNHYGEVITYPLEKIEVDDLLVRLPASEFARRLRVALTVAG